MDYEIWAEWYDIAYRADGDRGVDFHVELARASGGPVLEIGVGTGRLAIPALEAGIDVVGIDLNQPMLDEARRKYEALDDTAGSLELVQADMRTLDLGRTFPLVAAPARVLLLALTPEEQQETFHRLAAHLAPGGIFYFNMFTPNPDLISDDSRSPHLFGDAIRPETGNRVLMWNVNRFDTVAQTNHGLQIFEEIDQRGETVRKVTLDVVIRYLYPSEIHEMAANAGLEVEVIYGDFDRTLFTEDSSEQIFICRKAG